MNNHYRPSVKIVFIGDSGVGKSSIIGKYDKGVMPADVLPTVASAYLSKIFQVNDSEIELRMWDTAGQETYQSLAPIYFLNSMIGFVVFDITQPTTFKNVTKWITQLREYAGSEVIIVIVANKIDLESDRRVPATEYLQYAKTNGALLAETSAKTGEGINEMIKHAVNALLETNNDLRYEITSSSRRVNNLKFDGNHRLCC